MWYENRNVPDDAHDAIVELANGAGATAFAIDADDGWILVGADGSVNSANIASALVTSVQEALDRDEQILCIACRLAPLSFALITDQTVVSNGVPTAFHDAVVERQAAGDQLRWAAFDVDDGWVLITDTQFEARNINDECYQVARNLSDGHALDAILFTATGGWVVVAGPSIVQDGLPQDCADTIDQFIADGNQVTSLAFTGDGNGWSVLSTAAVSSAALPPMRVAEANVAGAPIRDTMALEGAPGLSVAVIENNTVIHETGYGVLKTGGVDAAHPESVFQAASVSKLVNALGILRLVSYGQILLDDDVLPHLDWTLESNRPTPILFAPATVSFRSLLRHSGGIMGRGTTASNWRTPFADPSIGGGFTGYLSEEAVPTLAEILDGATPAHSAKIVRTHRTDSRYSYSGSGTTLLQRAIEVITGASYQQWMTKNVLSPLGMTSSTFELGPPLDFVATDELAAGHRNLATINGDRNNYPESAAAGLYTTAGDLSRIIIMMNQDGTIEGGEFLPASLVSEMVTPSPFPNGNTDLGLGCFVQADDDYFHGGANKGFRSLLFGVPTENAGVVVMANGENTLDEDDADDLVWDVLGAVRTAFGW